MSGLKAKALGFISAATSGNPIQNLKSGVDAQTLWPASLAKESDKAASILRSFFVDGFIVPYRTIIKTSHGLAVFHILRDDLRSPAASGSGIIVARPSDESWSDAAGTLADFQLADASDLDVIDVVLVFRDRPSLDTAMGNDEILGKSLHFARGPLPQSNAGATGFSTKGIDTPVWVYAKSKGHIVDLDFTGLRLHPAQAENDRCYGVAGVSAQEILTGQVNRPSGSVTSLHATIKALDTQSGDFSGLSASGSCPGDKRVRKSGGTDGLS